MGWRDDARDSIDQCLADAGETDPRLRVLMAADLMAAPIGTIVGGSDRTWLEYSKKLLAKLDEVDPLRVCLSERGATQ